MADIDDDLLALAGDASSDEEDDAPMNISRESSAAPDKSIGRAGVKKSGGQKSNRRQNDSEEEGEA
jgi:RNA polymerase-associated protein RTF1